ncbi:hypothetical protein ACWF9B_00450 [Streptomyces sp. NPDC055089]
MTSPQPRTTVTVRIESDATSPDTAPAAFFVPDTHYFLGDPYKAPEQTFTFTCEHVTTHPRPGAGRRAFGFQRRNSPNAPWFSAALSEEDFADWTPTTPTTPTSTPH